METIVSNVRQLQDGLRQTISESYDGDATRLPKSEGNTVTVTPVDKRPSLQQFSNDANQFCFKSEKTIAENSSIEPPTRTLREPEIGEK